MTEPSSNGTAREPSPPAPPAGDLEQALRRIRHLEESLSKHREMLTGLLQMVDTIHASPAWHWLNRLSRLRSRLMPAHSYRRALCNRLLRAVQRFGRLFPRPARKIKLRSINRSYAGWIKGHEPGAQELDRQRQARFNREPRVSVLVSVHGAPRPLLRAMLGSVLAQTYGNWELCLAAGPSQASVIRELFHQLARDDRRLRLLALSADPGVADGLNAALAAATGDYVALLDQDDALAPFALYETVAAITRHPEADFFYSDEDCLTGPRGRRKHPHFKPDWSPDTLRGHNYVGHLTVFARPLVERAGGFRAGYEGDWNYDLILRASEQAARIVHIPKVLYHRRKHPHPAQGPTGAGPRKALAEHLARSGVAGEVKDGPRPRTYQVAYPLVRRPLVSIIILNKDHPDVLSRCLASVRKSTYANHEILIVENHSERPETFARYEELARQGNVRLLTWEEPFNYSALNNFAARHAAGEVLLFLNNDVEAINADWLERLLEHALRPEVGAVGAKLYYPDGTIQHAGAIVGVFHGVGHYQRSFPGDSAGYGNRLVTVQNLSAVTGACLMMRREVFAEVGGFDEWFVVTFNDIDLCLKVRRKGYRVIWTPHAELYHHECTTRGHDITPDKRARVHYEMTVFQWRWAEELRRGDPYYNPNLTLEREDCSLRV